MEITATKNSIDFGATGESEIIQNIQTILTTIKGTVPLDRGFGLDITSLDGPIQIVKAKLTHEIVNAIQEYEPRVNVESVQFHENRLEGKLIPIVKVNLKEGVEF
ncbi:GPW/gp25 family protein [Chengkuizengella axinellae]|uniref:GPW/gp25 family protein n=1 Tax=Chengkuizengella axinellae TaxID=3064388 RepID=A0ABT9J688_9BACL|nr:GPW/gp25 family protein [Chengkuizengella sp. 2205SS18-9]MDP5277136.1 GPW/gp25 family protein [Chengkuizengella sp. 2205SS18-9]